MLRQITKALLKDLFSCLISAILIGLSFHEFNFCYFAWVGFIPLFSVVENKNFKAAFLFSYFTGVIFWFFVIHWLIHVTLAGLIVLVLYLAIYFGLFGAIISSKRICKNRLAIFIIPSVWVLLEYVRSYLFTGFPWALLAHSQAKNLCIIQISDIFGAWGISFLIVMGNVLIKEIIGSRLKAQGSRPKEKLMLIIASLLLLAAYFYGFYILCLQPPASNLERVRISVIQANIPQEEKWDYNFREFIFDRYLTLSTQAYRDKPELIIWPESSVPAVLEEESDYYKRSKRGVSASKRYVNSNGT